MRDFVMVGRLLYAITDIPPLCKGAEVRIAAQLPQYLAERRTATGQDTHEKRMAQAQNGSFEQVIRFQNSS